MVAAQNLAARASGKSRDHAKKVWRSTAEKGRAPAEVK